MRAMSLRALVGSLALAMIGLAAGCDSGPPGGGLTNGPAPDLSAENPAVRSGLPPPEAPKQGEILGETGDNSTNAGTGGRGQDGASVPPVKGQPKAPAGTDSGPSGAKPPG